MLLSFTSYITSTFIKNSLKIYNLLVYTLNRLTDKQINTFRYKVMITYIIIYDIHIHYHTIFSFLFNTKQLGKGLGKKEDGIAAPVRASLKFDQTGIGYDTANADSYNDKWWTRTYNDVANRIDVKNKVMSLLFIQKYIINI